MYTFLYIKFPQKYNITFHLYLSNFSNQALCLRSNVFFTTKMSYCTVHVQTYTYLKTFLQCINTEIKKNLPRLLLRLQFLPDAMKSLVDMDP